jgi:hypothetical protein
MNPHIIFQELNMEKGYEKTYNWVRSLLKDCDFSDSSRRLGLTLLSENVIPINFLGRTYNITKEGIELIQQKTAWTVDVEIEFILKSILGYYVLSEANTEPLYDYCSLGNFSNGVFRESSSWLSGLNRAFSDTFGNNHEKFKKIIDPFGMVYREENKDGKYVWDYDLFPKMPIKLVFYEGDE